MDHLTTQKLVLVGGDIVTSGQSLVSNLWIESDLIEKISSEEPAKSANAKILDVSDCYVTPGLIDLQVNGGPPCDFWADAKQEDVRELCRQLLVSGVTSILPTLITDDIARLQEKEKFWQSLGASTRKEVAQGNIKTLSTCFDMRVPGLHLEGPCISPNRLGVHPPQFAQPLNLELLKKIISDEVLLITLAPELEPTGESIKWLIEKGITVTLGHSNATLSEARAAFTLGVQLMTHTFNALPPLLHRAPGAIGAAFLEPQLSCCVIADGQHVDPAVVEIIYKIKGVDHVVLVSDVAHVGTSQGGLVGSSIFLDTAVKNMVKWGIASFAEAIKMATVNAARAIGIENKVGSLEPDMYADIVVWHKQTLEIKHVIVNGKLVQS